MHLSKTAQFILSNVMASFGISMSISFFMTIFLNGFQNDFFSTWMSSFWMGYVIAVPSSMIFVPLVSQFMKAFVKNPI